MLTPFDAELPNFRTVTHRGEKKYFRELIALQLKGAVRQIKVPKDAHIISYTATKLEGQQSSEISFPKERTDLVQPIIIMEKMGR